LCQWRFLEMLNWRRDNRLAKKWVKSHGN